MPKTVQWNIIIIIIIITVVVVFVDDDTYYWVYLSSDHPFQVYYKVRQVLLQSAPGITKCDNFITKCDRTFPMQSVSTGRAALKQEVITTGG